MKPEVVTPLVGVVNSNISVGTDTAECMDAIMDDPSRAMVRYLQATSQCSGAQIPFTLDFDLTGVLTHLPIVPHICASELGQH